MGYEPIWVVEIENKRVFGVGFFSVKVTEWTELFCCFNLVCYCDMNRAMFCCCNLVCWSSMKERPLNGVFGASSSPRVVWFAKPHHYVALQLWCGGVGILNGQSHGGIFDCFDSFVSVRLLSCFVRPLQEEFNPFVSLDDSFFLVSIIAFFVVFRGAPSDSVLAHLVPVEIYSWIGRMLVRVRYRTQRFSSADSNIQKAGIPAFGH